MITGRGCWKEDPMKVLLIILGILTIFGFFLVSVLTCAVN